MKLFIKDLILLIRPHHWIKNFLVIAPAFFAGIVFLNLENFLTAFYAFVSFSLISSSGYLVNDLFDLQNDKKHPKKKERPLPSGRFNLMYAYILIPFLILSSLLVSLNLNTNFRIIILVYLTVSVLYSINFKNIVILDAICIAAGFIFRIMAGGAASDINISPWLYLTTLSLSFLLAFGKRRSELNISNNNYEFRKVLHKYSTKFLDISILVTSIISILTFCMYGISKNNKFILMTIPFVFFGLYRYTYLIRVKSNGEPTEALLKDRWLFICVFSWIIIMGLITNFNNVFSFYN